MRHDLISVYCPIDYTSIIKKYCEVFGITEIDLKKPCRVYKGVHIDWLRMCLSYHLKENLQIPTKIVAKAVGYKHHSAVCHNSDIMKNYIDVKDPYLYPYWQKLNELRAYH